MKEALEKQCIIIANLAAEARARRLAWVAARLDRVVEALLVARAAGDA